MPLHLNDKNVALDIEGRHNALIVPCYLCPAVTVAVRENKPFIQLFRHFLKSPPFEQHLNKLQADLKESGIEAKVFSSRLPHHWFLCMWTGGRRRKLKQALKNYDAAIVLGCDSATETVRELVESTSCKVVQGMDIVGFMNAKIAFHLPCDITFEDCKIVPLTQPGGEG